MAPSSLRSIFLLVCLCETNGFFLAPSYPVSRENALFSAAAEEDKATDEKTPATEAKNAPKHDTGGGSIDDLPEAVRRNMMAYQEHQQNAPKLSAATDVRTLVAYNHGFCVISTHSKAHDGYPSGSVVAFAQDPADGSLIFLFSGMSTHTQDLLVDPRCSVTVASKEFKGAADGRVNLLGSCARLRDEDEISKAKEIYMAKHPGAFWAEFGDFHWYKMQLEKPARYVGGFARAGTVSVEEYREAQPDAISEFGGAIAQHMNEDHMSATVAMVKAIIPGLIVDDDEEDNPIEEAVITSVDSLGMFVKVTRQQGVAFLPKSFKCRLPFSRPATDRADVRALIVEMTQAAAKEDSS